MIKSVIQNKSLKLIDAVLHPFLLTCLIGFLLIGCATTREKQALVEYENMKEEYFPEKDVSGESSNPQELSADAGLSDYLKYGALHNPGLKAAFEAWKAALEKVPQVRSLPDPKFTYTYYISEIETRVGPQKNKYGIAQSFPWPEKLNLKSNAALAAAEAQRQKFESMKRKLFADIKLAWYETYYIAKAIEITEENINLLKQLEGVARTRYTTGGTPFATVIKVQVELGKLENQRRSLKDMTQAVTAKLNASINRSPDTPITPSPSIENPGFPLSDEEALSLATENNPELKVLDHETEMRKFNLAAAKREFYPDITLGLDYIDTRESIMPNVEDNGKDPVMVMASLNIPLWFGKYRAAIREAESRYRAAQNERQNRQNEIFSALKMALYQFRDADRRISLFQDTLIPTARESLGVSEQAFISGKADFMNVIDAQRILLEFELSQERALADKNKKLAEIEKLLGSDIARIQTPDHENSATRSLKERDDKP